jgi:hypothetical protein
MVRGLLFAFSGTGFSREGVGRHAAKLMVLALAASRLKAGPTSTARIDSGTGFSREGVGRHAAKLMVLALAASRLKPVLPSSSACMLSAAP